jgi:hypothetical protein
MVSLANFQQRCPCFRTGLILISMVVISLASPATAAIITTPGLTQVRVWESTGPMTAYNFAFNGPQMTTQLGVGTLGPSTNDFSPLQNENYDVFYSDANGNFNVFGNYVTVEAVYPPPLPSGGGLNLGAVDLIIAGSPVRANILSSWVGLGNNYIPGSEVLAVDPDNFPLAPATATTMGSTVVPPAQHLRVTVTWSRLVPEPSTALLISIGVVALVARRSRRSS